MNSPHLGFGIRAGIFLAAIFGAIQFTMVLVNLAAGCESWDKETWNRNSRCYSLTELVGRN